MSDPEQVLYTFGPFGVSLCRGPYGVFKWQQTNITRVEFTDTRIRGLKQRAFSVFGRSDAGGEPVFDIPYDSIQGVRRLPHPARLGLQDVLEFTYGAAGEPTVLSIACYKEPAARALDVLRRFVPPERFADGGAPARAE